MTCSMLSAIIAAVAARKKIRKSPLDNEVKARALKGGELGPMSWEFNCLACLDGVDRAGPHKNTIVSNTYPLPATFHRSTAVWRAAQLTNPTRQVVSRIRELPCGTHIRRRGIHARISADTGGFYRSGRLGGCART